ncbi:MAG: sigma-70 family RNA polymerase sigma factor [Alphaproteobacteria bacterium]|nr:sigma-70 family RNA polymerase sigma factor [Alphaproteobacteria bacterium]
MKNIIKNYKTYIKTIIKNKLGFENNDLEQEVYIKIWQNLNKFNPEKGELKSWLSTITNNLCIDYFRSKTSKNQTLNIDDSNQLLETIEDLQISQEDILDTKKRQKIILQAINSLPQKLRQIVILYEYEEYSYEEIAKKLNLPIGTVKSRLSNARLVLKKILTPLLKGE